MKSPWWRDLVLYAVYVRGFYDSDGDGKGDLRGLAEKLPYVRDLGVGAVWLLPIFPSPLGDDGYDSFRVDAVPYLFERDGVGGENLPETHEFLERLRGVVDGYEPERVLIAEANRPTEELVRYFGDGDEFDMAFHFPLMPRLFLAIQKEHASPLTEVIERSFDLPDNCQWVMFLRNHDELTLAMIADDDRTYLWEHGDRMGVRTPMQWSAEWNGRTPVDLIGLAAVPVDRRSDLSVDARPALASLAAP